MDCHDRCDGPISFTGYCEKHGAPRTPVNERIRELEEDLNWIATNCELVKISYPLTLTMEQNRERLNAAIDAARTPTLPARGAR